MPRHATVSFLGQAARGRGSGRPTGSTHPGDFRLDRAADALGTAELGPERPVAHHRLIVATAGARDDHLFLGMRARPPDAGESVDRFAELPYHDLDIHIVLKTPYLAVEACDTGLGSLAGSRKRMAEVGELAGRVAIELVGPARVELVTARVAAVVPERRHHKHRSLTASQVETRSRAALKLRNLTAPWPCNESALMCSAIALIARAAANSASSRSVTESRPQAST